MKLKIDRETAHATLDEIEFIDGLGTHSKHNFDKKILINKYISSIRARKNWGDVDKNLIFSHAMKRYLNETN